MLTMRWINKTHLFWASIALTLLSLVCYWAYDEILYKFGLLAMLPVLICLLLLSTTIFQSFIRKFYPPVYVGLIVFIPMISILFTSRLIFKASLRDDRSRVDLILRRNKRFELTDMDLFGSDEHGGTYKIVKDKIILQNRSEKDNKYIPDTLTIDKNKVVMFFDKNGDPDTSFSRYFEIERNQLD